MNFPEASLLKRWTPSAAARSPPAGDQICVCCLWRRSDANREDSFQNIGQTEVKKRRYGGVKEIIQANIDPAGAAGAAPAWRGSVGFFSPPPPHCSCLASVPPAKPRS